MSKSKLNDLEKSQVVDFYTTGRLNQEELAFLFNVHRRTIQRALWSNGVEPNYRRSKGGSQPHAAAA